MRMSCSTKVACLLAVVSCLAVPQVRGATVSFEPLPAAQDNLARREFLPSRNGASGEDAAADVRELAALIKSIPSAAQRNGARFLTPSPVPPVLVRNPFLSTAP